MSVLSEVLEANESYATAFDKGDLALPPARGFAILTCMDARLDPAKYAGLSEGDAHVIRNAGGRASDDAIRSLVISYKLLATKEWFVIHHTDCGSQGGFNRSSQHLDRGGVQQWRRSTGLRRRARFRKGLDASGVRTGRCGRRCARLGGRSPRGRFSGSSGV